MPSKRPTAIVVVLMTCPNRRTAGELAEQLVAGRLAACVNIIPAVQSIFRWKGKVDRCRELLLIVKTTSRRVKRLRHAVIALHPYEVPELIVLTVTGGHRPYLRWVASCLSPS